VIGTRKFIYDIWGDAVNLASRMESLGAPGRIQVTHAVQERLAGRFLLEPRGLIEVKGKGPTPAWFLVARDGTSGDAPGQSAAAAWSPGPDDEHPATWSTITPG
jgi:class 3 adenylate cyclase